MASVKAFRESNTFQVRKEEAREAKDRHPDRVPVICEPASKILKPLERSRFLVPADLPLKLLARLLRRRLGLPPTAELRLFSDTGELELQGHVADVYSRNRDNDDMLYLRYAEK